MSKLVVALGGNDPQVGCILRPANPGKKAIKTIDALEGKTGTVSTFA